MMFVLLHSTRHNEEMTSDDVIYIFLFYGKRGVFHRGIYKSSAVADRTCWVVDRSSSNHNMYSWYLRICFSDTSRLLDTFVWPDWGSEMRLRLS